MNRILRHLFLLLLPLGSMADAAGVSGSATLKGGIITSTRAAEEQGNNRFITDRLILQDLDNFSHYKGKSIGIGLNAAISGDNMGQQQNPHLANQGGSGIKAQGIGHGSANGNESGITHASINTRNLLRVVFRGW